MLAHEVTFRPVYVCSSCRLDKGPEGFYPCANAIGRQYNCKDCARETARLHARTHRDKQHEWQREHPEAMRASARKTRLRIREKCLAAYGGKCVCCGVTDPQKLAIDHIAGGGKAHRRRVAPGSGFYWWLQKQGFPEDFRLLCHNCNTTNGLMGGCPHDPNAIMKPISAVRMQALQTYGAICVRCGEDNPYFLAIDHTFGDGAEHRKETGSGSRLFHWLRKNGYPKDRFRVLCHNCNLAAGLYQPAKLEVTI